MKGRNSKVTGCRVASRLQLKKIFASTCETPSLRLSHAEKGMSRKSEVHLAQIISHMQRSVKRVPRREALVLFQPWRKANKQEVERLCASFFAH